MRTIFLFLFLLSTLYCTAYGQLARKIPDGTPPVSCEPTGNNVYLDTTSAGGDFVVCVGSNKFQRISPGKVNGQTGTSYTFVAGDRGKLVTSTNDSPVAWTLPQATGSFLNGWFVYVYNLGAGTVTITPTTSTINGTTTISLASGEGGTIFSDGTNYVMPKTTTVASAGSAPQVSQIVSGGEVVWESAYTFRVSAATYYIQGQLYNSAEQTIALDAADGTFDRIDVIALNTSGTVVKITGTAAAQPSEPDIDPSTQLKLTFVYVTASSTQPSGVTNENIYLEGTEWTGSTSGSGWTLNSTSNPRTGTKDVEGTTVANNAYVQFQHPSTFTLDSYKTLNIYIKSKATWANNRVLRVQWFNAGVAKGSALTIASGFWGFSSSITASYQQIAIPVTSFAVPAGTTLNQLRITDSGGSIGLYMDDITLQSSSSTVGGSGNTGTVTSIDASGGVETSSGSPITSAGTIRGSEKVNSQTGTSYTIATDDRGKLITHSNGSATAYTLPQAGTNFPHGWYTDVQNVGAGTVTITPTTSTIDGGSSVALSQNEGVRIVSDGTNYKTFRGKSSGGGITGSFTSGRIPYTTGASSLADDPQLLWNNTTNVLTVDGTMKVIECCGRNVTLTWGGFSWNLDQHGDELHIGDNTGEMYMQNNKWLFQTNGTFKPFASDGGQDIGSTGGGGRRIRDLYMFETIFSIQDTGLTASTPMVDHTATWNNSGVTFENIKSNITDSASAAGSTLIDLKVGGSSKFKVDKTGAMTVTSCTGCGGGGSATDGATTWAFSGDITPTALSADQNNYNPTGLSTSSVLRLQANSADRNITGLQGGADGRVIIITNVGVPGTNFDVILKHESGSSTDVNRFYNSANSGGQGDIRIRPRQGIMLWYDTAEGVGRWKALTGPINSDSLIVWLGSTTNPSLSFATKENYGFYHDGNNAIPVVVNGTDKYAFNTSSFLVKKGQRFGFASGGLGATGCTSCFSNPVDGQIAVVNQDSDTIAATIYAPTRTASSTINLAQGNTQRITLTTNTTFADPTNKVDGIEFTLVVIQDGTGSRTGTWNGVFKWAGGIAPVLTLTANAVDIFRFWTDGTNVYELSRSMDVK